jgi:organic hydroperoxide reductase OsmC/OhrA
MAAESQRREYSAAARSTSTFGRVLCSCRDQHFVVDGPVQNGCPGEAVTPGELFLTSIAACGVELVQVFALEEGATLQSAAVDVAGHMDLDDPPRDDVTVFNSVHLEFRLDGVDAATAEHLVKRFKGR